MGGLHTARMLLLMAFCSALQWRVTLAASTVMSPEEYLDFWKQMEQPSKCGVAAKLGLTGKWAQDTEGAATSTSKGDNVAEQEDRRVSEKRALLVGAVRRDEGEDPSRRGGEYSAVRTQDALRALAKHEAGGQPLLAGSEVGRFALIQQKAAQERSHWVEKKKEHKKIAVVRFVRDLLAIFRAEANRVGLLDVFEVELCPIRRNDPITMDVLDRRFRYLLHADWDYRLRPSSGTAETLASPSPDRSHSNKKELQLFPSLYGHCERTGRSSAGRELVDAVTAIVRSEDARDESEKIVDTDHIHMDRNDGYRADEGGQVGDFFSLWLNLDRKPKQTHGTESVPPTGAPQTRRHRRAGGDRLKVRTLVEAVEAELQNTTSATARNT